MTTKQRLNELNGKRPVRDGDASYKENNYAATMQSTHGYGHRMLLLMYAPRTTGWQTTSFFVLFCFFHGGHGSFKYFLQLMAARPIRLGGDASVLNSGSH